MPYTSRKELHQQLEAEMYRALQSDLGNEIRTPDPERLRSELNFARRAAREVGNNDFDMLVFRTCPQYPENFVWIVRKITTPEFESESDQE